MVPKDFSQVPVDEDTKILHRELGQIDTFPILHEKWFWEGIKAESIIFITKEVEGLEPEALIELVKKSKYYKSGSSVTFKATDAGYTFVNYNFQVPA